MSVNVAEIGKVIESIYRPEYAYDWDNSGFQVNLNNNTNHVLVCLDVTPQIIREAAELGCWLIVSHHPLFFRPKKTLDTLNYVDNCVIELIKHGISLYSAHTTADNAADGINARLADILGLENRTFLEPLVEEHYYKITVSVPTEYAENVKKAMATAGAGELGNYKGCNFTLTGVGEFVPNDEANPHIGKANQRETVEEAWIQALVPDSRLPRVLAAVRSVHPYEEPAIDVFMLKSPKRLKAGAGIAGDLKKDSTNGGIVRLLKDKLNLEAVRMRGEIENKVSRIALCSGAGGDFAEAAKKAGAQLFITGEMKHNYYVESSIDIIELGHYESEKCFCAMMADSLQRALVDVKYNVTVRVAEKMEKPYFDY